MSKSDHQMRYDIACLIDPALMRRPRHDAPLSDFAFHRDRERLAMAAATDVVDYLRNNGLLADRKAPG